MISITKNSLLYKSDVEYADFSINHVLGCSHGCTFPCYAFMMAKRFGKVQNYNEWIKPKIVKNALELLDKEIPKYKDKIKFVHLCFTTDPFMYRQPEIANMSLRIIEKLNSDGIKCTILTKGILPKALTNKDKYGENNEYGITLVSLNQKFKGIYEPYSAPYMQRVRALKHLHDKGLRTWVSMEPYPTPNLAEQNVLEILKKITFVDKIVFGKLNYNVKSKQFENNAGFYNDCAKIVIDFCKKHNIDYHIKFGTQQRNEKNTAKLFLT